MPTHVLDSRQITINGVAFDLSADRTWTISSLPSQTSQAGKYLTTDGANASWAVVNSLPSQTSNGGKFLTTDGANASWATVGTDIPLNTQVASYTLVLTDDGKLILLNVGTANTLTVPPNSSVAFPIGATITVCQLGAGQITFTPGAAVVLQSAGAFLKSRVQYSVITLIKIATDTWIVSGDTTA